MQKFLQFFFIGLIFGAFVLWVVQRDLARQVEFTALKEELDSLKWVQSSEFITRSFHENDNPVRVPEIQGDIQQTRENAITRAISATSNAVVGISVEQVTEVVNPYVPRDPLFRMFLDEKYWPRTIQQQASSLGSGFIVTQDGYIVTNEHVVRNATSIVVTTTVGKKYQAKIVGTDELLDMALIKIDEVNLPFIDWANSDEAIVGEWVVAIGNPYGLFDVNDQPSVAVGVISALNRDFERDVDGRLYTDMIQTDAAINRGNSGGPLIDAEGRAVGMNTLIFTESGGSVGIGFAIPSNRIVNAIDDLVKGGVDRNFWLGIRANDLRGMLWKMLNLAENRGAVVTGVDPGSPADRAGIKVEDVILKINDRTIDCSEDAKEFMNNTDIRVGDTLTFVISRHGTIMTKEVELIPIPKARSYIPG
ncbi:MAG: trypsin-like peptidase domain-containing protein [Calditrichaeota bacterium]|nr:trypsin-like peptidase domain-containing protein [Calditrichota bacterium]MCB9368250.1 trypsin-like peptidase domain-containing protein [Calditrichota bacterium]